MLNSAGLQRLGLSDHVDGRLRSADPSWAVDRREVPLADLSLRLARHGVTGITDATPHLDGDALLKAHRLGDVLQRVQVLAPGKRILHDDSLDFGELTRWIAERGDQYLDEVPTAEHDELWRVATLVRAGVSVALSTDAPFGDGDPWASMRAAVHRRTATGEVLGARERIDGATALVMFTGRSERPAVHRLIAEGEPGDLCVLAATPARVLAELDAELVAATIVAGEVIWQVS